MHGLSVGTTLPALPPSHSYPVRNRAHESESSQQHAPYPMQSHSDITQQARKTTTQVENNVASMIARHLQIPESVNKSKGSLAEFAAEVRLATTSSIRAVMLTTDRLPASFGLKVPRP
jgi:hypothetical protein